MPTQKPSIKFYNLFHPSTITMNVSAISIRTTYSYEVLSIFYELEKAIIVQ